MRPENKTYFSELIVVTYEHIYTLAVALLPYFWGRNRSVVMSSPFPQSTFETSLINDKKRGFLG